MGHADLNPPSSREPVQTPQKTAQQPPSALDYRRQAQVQAQFQQSQQMDLAPVPHNEYPTDGMTMFCRTDGASERSSVNSPIRPSSRDSQSDYSNPTSLSSIEPASGKVSPIKQDPGMVEQPISPNKQIVQKKRSGFFSNSPFRRKSKHERDEQRPYSMAPPSSRNTWGSSSSRNGGSNNPSPTRPGIQTRDFAASHSHSPEPVDPRANFQLNVGPNVFDVASPDSHRKPPAANLQPQVEDLDPIAQALAELKGVTKQSSVRMSADRYHGIATPAPPGTPGTPAALQRTNNDVVAAQRGTPPPSYHDQPVIKRLDLPKPAFTSAQMQQTTRSYVGKNQDMYGSPSRPGTRGNGAVDMPPRATSPLPTRSASPRPGLDTNPRGQGHGQNSYARSASPRPGMNVTNQNQNTYSRSASPRPGPNSANQGANMHTRSASPNPYASSRPATNNINQGNNPHARSASPNPYAGRSSGQPQSQSRSVGNSPVKQGGYGSANTSMDRYSRHTSPNDIRRAASPQPQPQQQFSRPERERPSSSAGAMALQLSDGGVGAYGGSPQGGGGGNGNMGVGRPLTYYGGSRDQGSGGRSLVQAPQGGERQRSKSVADGRQFTRDGRPILHFGKSTLKSSLFFC